MSALVGMMGAIAGGGASLAPSKYLLYAKAHGASATVTGGTAPYSPAAGAEYDRANGQWTVESPQRSFAAVDITLSLLQAWPITNTATGTSTVRCRVNGSNGNQVATVGAGSTTRGNDASNTDAVTAGTSFNTALSVAGTGTYTAAGARMVMQPTTDNTKHWALYGAHGGGTVSPGTDAAWTPYGFNSGNPSGDRAEAFALWYCAATIERIDVAVYQNTLSVGTTLQVYINGVAVSGATATISAGSTATVTFAGLGAVSLASGDQIDLRTTVPAGTGSLILGHISMWTSTARATPVAVMAAHHVLGNVIATTTTQYGGLSGSTQTARTAESDFSVSHGFTGTASGMTIRVTSNPAGTCTMRYRVGGANGTQVITVGAAATGTFRDTTHSDSFGPTDECCYSFTRSSSTNFTYTHTVTVEEYVSG